MRPPCVESVRDYSNFPVSVCCCTTRPCLLLAALGSLLRRLGVRRGGGDKGERVRRENGWGRKSREWAGNEGFMKRKEEGY